MTGEMTVRGFLDALAARQSTPGGGGAAAVTGSQAAALVSMVINFTLGNKKYAAVQEQMARYLGQSEALRASLLELADRDVEAFDAVSACYAMPKETDTQKAERTNALQEALKRVAQVPFTTAERCLEVMHLAREVGAEGNANVTSDAATALYLANAALKSALVNVNINLKFIKDAAFVKTWSDKRDSLAYEAVSAYREGLAACEKVLGFKL